MSVEIVNRSRVKKVSPLRIRRSASLILDALKQRRVCLSIALVGNQAIRTLNARYRAKNTPTDVLSFIAGDTLPSGEKLLGDVVISVQQAAKQARDKNHSLEKELEILLIHGILHLLGYDHERSKKDAKAMRGLEQKIHKVLCESRALKV